MKRRLAQDMNKKNTNINKQSEPVNKVTNDAGSKLLRGESLTLADIGELGQRIAEQHGYHMNQLVVCEVTELSERLTSHQNTDGPIFVICHHDNTTAVFSIVQIQASAICLYTDFLNEQIPETIKDILQQRFGENIEFKIKSKIEEVEKEKDYDILSLHVLETFMSNLKSDKIHDFIMNFNNPRKTYFGRLKNGIVALKNELMSLTKEGYYKTFASDIVQLSVDSEFKKAIKKFIDNIPSSEQVDNFKNYQTLLKEFVELEESGSEINLDLIKKLEEARKNAFSKIEDVKIQTSQNEQGDQQLDIVKNFPTQMEKFTRIFEPLAKSNVDENLDKILERISAKLDLKYDRLKSFFKAKGEVKKDSNNNTYRIKNIEDVVSSLPKCSNTSEWSLNWATAQIYLFLFMIFQYLVGWRTNQIEQKSNKVLKININHNTEKPVKRLLAEITVENIETLDYLRDSYNKVKNMSKIWKRRQALDINSWAVSKKGNLGACEVCEALAVMDRANELTTGGHRLRDTQILSVLAFLHRTDKGQLSQIQTGEGKTTIVSILAAIKVLQGETVDIVTSNPVLATEAIRDKSNFYNLLGLSVTTNNPDENYKGGERDCYKADIVYGSISSFQFDYLRDSFLGMNTLAGRPFNRIILDEVDSMIIDNASHIAKLAGPFPGMESLKYVYIKIWQELHKAEQVIVEEFRQDLKTKAQQLLNVPESQAQLLYNEYKENLEQSIIPKIKNHIKSSNPTDIDIIPSNIKEYAAKSLDRWINSAIDAKYNYREDEQYVIRNTCNGEASVQPVDYANTGITLKNTVWQYGLHQFLQLKHNLHLTTESLTSCFISNLGYINKYGDKIFGLTGTLGSKAEQELLSSVYNVGFSIIPTYKEKKFREFKGEVVPDEAFGEIVADDVATEVTKGRSSLIICETIKDAKLIREVFGRKYKNIVIKHFLDEDNAAVTEEEIKPGEVVIATNIAGRGTDFKTSAELEAKGGFHVCVAFLPCNKRVEDQAFGRTARQGNNGTAKLFIRTSEVNKLPIDSDCFTQINWARDQLEAERIENIKQVRIQELKFQDKLFELFSALYRKLKRDDQSEGEYQYALDDLKEFWAFWLEKKNFNGLDLINKNPVQEFKEFECIAAETIKGTIQFNPYYSILQAEHFILNEKLDKAEKSLNHAIGISKNPDILHSAYLKHFEIAVEKGRVLMDKFKDAVGDMFFINKIKSDKEYKEKAKKYLRDAKKALKKELDYIERLFGAEEFTNIINTNDNTLNDETKIDNLFIKHLWCYSETKCKYIHR